MGSITIRINNELKEKSYAVLERLGVTPSEFIRQALEYVAEQQRSPFKIVVLTDEDEELLAIVRERLAKPSPKIRISLDDL
ncbi:MULTISPECIES: type II toxin-antitoxin system RelB/DinJ family antitoxin [Aeromonas]|uniref:type II toxin-antitoxin system RelB/DinJ family antitoxin n=1 Tax=Aeromonas TaxID=642 RepID=UPI0009DE2C5D|nr:MULTISPECIES: type II toxin-antitoxin system RelB/DinJ family antitoxin [Aeromonas]